MILLFPFTIKYFKKRISAFFHDIFCRIPSFHRIFADNL